MVDPGGFPMRLPHGQCPWQGSERQLEDAPPLVDAPAEDRNRWWSCKVVGPNEVSSVFIPLPPPPPLPHKSLVTSPVAFEVTKKNPRRHFFGFKHLHQTCDDFPESERTRKNSQLNLERLQMTSFSTFWGTKGFLRSLAPDGC